MTAAAVHDFDARSARRVLSPVPSGSPAASAAPGPPPSPSPSPEAPVSVLLTVQIAVAGERLPPAAVGLFDSLRALAAHGVATELTVSTDVPPRPRLVRTAPGSGAATEAEPVAVAPGAGGSPVPVPEVVVHRPSRSVYRDGSAVRLTRREFDLLNFLCENPRRVFTRVQLLRQVWGYEPVSGERTVDVHVRRVRIKIDSGPYPVVATVRGVGYRLAENARVTLVGLDE